MIEVDLIKKHGKKALGMDEHEHHHKPTWRERVPEILLEIGIIVFAIMLSIQLHSWHEHALDRKTERKFLTGLRKDLQQDLQELCDDSLSYCTQVRGYRYFRSLTPPATVNPDSLKAFGWTLRNSTQLVPNTSRFEGLKSAGKLDVIEDDELLNSILDYYQEQLPALINNTAMFTDYKQQNMVGYLDSHLSADQQNLPAVMASPPMQNYLNRGNEMRDIVGLYHQVMEHSRQLIRQIDKQLAE
ncbi:hypothetical protein [Solirubrum puertoriconensis]|uniref:Uncharacterized protein n=1 Tax=Solirubrum puertoriconensis TaxID=1751427 RepID=A0A9X0L5M8_SOLP1|nr:hypothetical protein [Solirubrum puertoriconensis]KUG08868.1 hypothetical protein ASU33_12150 [Solirubrum puertoriconensis]